MIAGCDAQWRGARWWPSDGLDLARGAGLLGAMGELVTEPSLAHTGSHPAQIRAPGPVTTLLASNDPSAHVSCQTPEQAARRAGRAGPQRLLHASAGLRSIPAALGLGDATAVGPCATLSGEQTWCEQPNADGVVLAGDAAGYDDPVDGQGLPSRCAT